MIDKLTQIFKIEDLRKRILFVLGMLAIFRVMANIPMPGMNPEQLEEFFAQFQMFEFANAFTGGTMDKFSIAMLGLGPYITAVIVIQLLTMVFPKLERMYKEEGEQGKQKINQYGRLLTVPFAIMQTFGMLTLFQNQGVIEPLGTLDLIASILTVTAGTVFLMWLGELIGEKGIGNGVSIMIFAGIIANVPAQIYEAIVSWDMTQLPSYIMFIALAVFIVAAVVLVNEARRNIPVSYAKRVKGRKVYGGSSTYIPLNINPAGVIPIIFALSLMAMPPMIAQFLAETGGTVGSIAQSVGTFLENSWVQGIAYFGLVFLFTFFYTAVTFDPENVADNLKKMGGFVPGIRPGKPTEKHIRYILNRVLTVGALYLATIAVMPQIVAGITGVSTFQFLIGGASILIIVSVVLDTTQQINAQLQMREYEEI
ncbi:MAG: preprotein translocase subunit SecY [Patescibacteria group bacterium]